MTQEFIVSSLDDENDGDFSEGDLSLREAIALANDTEGEDTITFDSSLEGGTITLVQDQSSGRPTLVNAPLTITDLVTITGLGEANITIDGDNGGNGVFILDGEGTEIDVTIEDLTVANGEQIAFFSPGLSDPGGSFAVREDANLTLRNSSITGSSASIAGAIYNAGTVNAIDITVENSSSGNSAAGSLGSEIDGVVVNTGQMYISDNSIIDNNDGGAITNLGTLEVRDSQLTNNSSDYGGGAVDNRGDATIVGTQMLGNSGAGAVVVGDEFELRGTAIENSDDGNLTIIDSSIEDTGSGSSDNNVILSRGTTSISGTTITNNDGGGNVGVVVESGTTEIQNSTISDNRADNAQSGIIVRPEGTVNISNSTIANNQARSNAGIESSGTVNLTNSTVANNSGGLGAGGFRNFGTATITSTILAGNTGGPLIGDISGDGEFISGGNNLISNGDDGSGFVDGVDGDIVGTNGDDPENPNNDGLIDPQLGELQDNGGTTETIALLEGSPAIDTGSNVDDLEFDQRGEGFDRTVGEGTDIGAFEVQDLSEPPVTENLVVSTLDDENDGDFSPGDLSLREAIALANDTEGEDIITFDSALSGGTITLALGELTIDSSLTIRGLGAENITVDANGNSRVFKIDDGNEDTQIDVAIDSLAITGGFGGEFDGEIESFYNGGGILNSENLEINNANIFDNQTLFKGGGIYSNGTLIVNDSEIYSNAVGDGEDRTTAGGGIYSDGILTVNDSAIYSNSGFGSFGIATGGGITNAGMATINQSTISNNSVGGRLNNAGGIENRAGDLTITNSTISDNSSDLTGGILNNEGEVTVTSTIIANDGNQNISGDDFISGGNNFISGEAEVASRVGPVIISAEGFTNGENGDIVGTLEDPIDPLSGELQDNGGSTPTQALLEGSPAIDAGSNSNDLEFDQRGEGFDRTVGGATDIGAFEVQNLSVPPVTEDLVVSTLDDENDGDFSEGDLSLREAISIAESGNTISFDSSLSGGTINLSLGDLIIDKSLNIEGLGADRLTIDAGKNAGNFNVRVFQVDDGNSETIAEVEISGLTITGGNAGQYYGSNAGNIENAAGGGIFNAENLRVDSSVISNNTAIVYGGGIYNTGEVSVTNSTITGNNITANSLPISGDGGGIFNRGIAFIENSTVSNNVGISAGGIANNSNGYGDPVEIFIRNSTITGNSGIDRQGIPEPYSIGAGAGVGGNDRTTIVSSIIAGNETDLTGDIISDGNNLIGNGNDSERFLESDLVGTPDNPIDPLLGELQNNGGSIPTISIAEDSPAIDTGSNPNDLEFDQRGDGFDRTVGSATDIGAFEVQDLSVPPVTEDLVVSTLDDENDGDFSEGDLSLREAISIAESGNTISFDSSLSGGTINLSLGELAIDRSLTIDGLGANNLTIDGNNESRIFLIDDGDSNSTSEVFINGLTIANGNTGEGSFPEINGGGFFNQENLTIDGVALISNRAGNGGAIYSTNQLQLNNSLVAETDDGTGPIYNDGGVASIFNTTIANNDVGGIGAIVNNAGAELNVTNSTISYNNSFDAAVFNSEDSSANFASTIIAGNSGEVEPNRDNIIGDFNSNGNNLIGNTNGGTGFNHPSDLVGTVDNPLDPLLGELQDNGGATQTIELLEGSPAIDAGSNPNDLQFDQRGDGFDRTVGEGTDIGAFEVQNLSDSPVTEDLVVSTLDDENDGDFSSGDLSLREAIALASVSEGGDIITFDSALSGGTISLNSDLSNELIISDSVSIIGLGQDNLTLDGAFVFKLPEFSAELNLDGLNIVGGTVDSFGDLNISDTTISQSLATNASPSSIVSRGALNLSDSNVIGSSNGGDLGIAIESGTADIANSTIANHAGFIGSSGIVITTNETVNITNSTIANNSNRSAGGVINTGGGTVNIANTTIANNGGLAGGGILNSSGTITLASSIVAGNGGSFDGVGDVSGDGEFISNGNNLISNGDDAEAFVDGVNGDIVGTNGDDPENPHNSGVIDPQLGELQNNGGSTLTFALLEDSPAIDAGSNPNHLEFDQRGEEFDRTVGEGTDIGAFEVQQTDEPEPLEDDLFYGTDGDDTLNGNGGLDIINGGSGNDDLLFQQDRDTLIGCSGDNTLSGNNGSDIFILESGDSLNNIVDFIDGSDLFELGVNLSFNDLSIVSNESGSGVLILDTSDNNAVLASIDRIDVADIDDRDFINI